MFSVASLGLLPPGQVIGSAVYTDTTGGIIESSVAEQIARDVQGGLYIGAEDVDVDDPIMKILGRDVVDVTDADADVTDADADVTDADVTDADDVEDADAKSEGMGIGGDVIDVGGDVIDVIDVGDEAIDTTEHDTIEHIGMVEHVQHTDIEHAEHATAGHDTGDTSKPGSAESIFGL
jgi:hypothetical protein